MIYLRKFTLPSLIQEEQQAHRMVGHSDDAYPYGIFPLKQLTGLSFDNITLFYGNNGSGKSTLLNLIAEMLRLPRATPYYQNMIFSDYVSSLCSYELSVDEEGLDQTISPESKIITSEDIFNQIIQIRHENIKTENRRSNAADDYVTNKYAAYAFHSLDDYETLKTQNEARSKTQRKFIDSRAGREIKQFSNGETAVSYYNKEFKTGGLYLLDEPENSLSPQFQLQLADLILECARYCDCQFVIATHSPLLLSLGMVYDLDAVPCVAKRWTELENVKVYYNFFKQNENQFKL